MNDTIKAFAQHDYKSDRERLEQTLDDSFDNDIFSLGRQQGAMDLCSYLRGKVDPTVLMNAWEWFLREHGI